MTILSMAYLIAMASYLLAMASNIRNSNGLQPNNKLSPSDGFGYPDGSLYTMS